MNSYGFLRACLLLSMMTWTLTNGFSSNATSRFNLTQNDSINETIDQNSSSIRIRQEPRRVILRLQQIVNRQQIMLNYLSNQTSDDMNLRTMAIQNNLTHYMILKSKRHNLILLIFGIIIITCMIAMGIYYCCHSERHRREKRELPVTLIGLARIKYTDEIEKGCVTS